MPFDQYGISCYGSDFELVTLGADSDEMILRALQDTFVFRWSEIQAILKWLCLS